jgi:S1-C subfamily serine protease
MFCVVFTVAISLESPYLHKSYMRKVAENNAVQILGKNGSGTGFHVERQDGKVFILTNKHVCEMEGPLKVKRYGDKIGIVSSIIKKSKDHDLCVLQPIEDSGIKIGSEPENGDTLYTLGHPRGDALTVANGELIDDKEIQLLSEFEEDGSCNGETLRVEGFFGTQEYCVITRRAIQFSTPTYPGNSGSAIVNKFGNLVGVVFAGSRETENMGFGVPFSYVKSFLNSLK